LTKLALSLLEINDQSIEQQTGWRQSHPQLSKKIIRIQGRKEQGSINTDSELSTVKGECPPAEAIMLYP